MVETRTYISFILNGEPVQLENLSSTATLLDYLRLEKHLTGTTEGCAEGDCGACTALVGRLSNGKLVYETVNTCIRFLASLDACHVVTIEHLKKADGSLHPVQQAMVDEHGSQCGFCTPGIVMSLYALWMSNPKPDQPAIETALQGNLCRCTGYAPIIRAAQAASDNASSASDQLNAERDKITTQLKELKDGKRVEPGTSDDPVFIPASLDDLAELRSSYPHSTLVAGATDVGLWVTKHLKKIAPVIFINHLDELQTIEINTQGITLGAGVTYDGLHSVIDEHISPTCRVVGTGSVGNRYETWVPLAETSQMVHPSGIPLPR